MEKINKKELAKIFNGIKFGDNQSFNYLYELYYKLVYSIAFSIIKNKEHSEDVAQNVFEKIYKMPKESLPESYEASWLYTVTKNEALQFIKKHKNHIDLDSIYDIEKCDENINQMIDKDYYNSIMKKLNQKEKEIVTLKILSGLTFSQIGKILNMPIGTVQWIYYKSINVLKVSISTLTAVLITFAIGLSEITKQKNTIQEDKQNSNKKNVDESACEKQQTNNVEDIKNETIQIVETSKNKDMLQQNKLETYSLFGVSFIIFISGIIIVKKIKNKIYKKN